MITENYVSFETAKLLKEKGFNAEIDTYYSPEGEFKIWCPNGLKSYLSNEGTETWWWKCIAPAQSMAMKWLREVHHIHTEICLYKTSEDDIEPKKSRKAPYYTFGVWNSVSGDNVDKRLTNDFIGDTYEVACEAAIKYCLENIIK